MAPISTPHNTSTATAISKSSTLSNRTPDSNEPTIAIASEDTGKLDASQISASKKRKRKEKPHIVHQCTFRRLEWMYFHLRLITPSASLALPVPPPTGPSSTISPSNTNSSPSSNPTDIDALTTLTLLTPALSSFLGLIGASIPIDILHTCGRDVVIRVPRQDARGVQAALGAWTGVCDRDLVPGVEDDGEGRRVRVAWRVVRCEAALAGVGLATGGDGGDLFNV